MKYASHVSDLHSYVQNSTYNPGVCTPNFDKGVGMPREIIKKTNATLLASGSAVRPGRWVSLADVTAGRRAGAALKSPIGDLNNDVITSGGSAGRGRGSGLQGCWWRGDEMQYLA